MCRGPNLMSNKDYLTDINWTIVFPIAEGWIHTCLNSIGVNVNTCLKRRFKSQPQFQSQCPVIHPTPPFISHPESLHLNKIYYTCNKM